MKILLAMITLTTLVLALNAQAADKKLGNVIAVERSVEDIYDVCISQIQRDKKHNPSDRYFVCTLNVGTVSTDTSPSGQRILTVRSPACTIDTELKDSKIFLMVSGNEAKANFASARACLKAAMDEHNDSLKFVVFTIE